MIEGDIIEIVVVYDRNLTDGVMLAKAIDLVNVIMRKVGKLKK
jgi:hypothetical protein